MFGVPMRGHLAESNREAALVVVNPVAGGGRGGRVADGLEAALRAQGIAYVRRDTDHAGHARQLAAAAAGVVIVVGGDGTVHDAVAGLPERDGRLGPLAVLPCGRGDDFAAAVGFGRNPAALAARLRAGSTRCVDLGEAELTGRQTHHRRFVNVAGLGFDAEVAARAQRGRHLRGRALYVAATLAALRRLPRFWATLELDLGHAAPPLRQRVELAFVSACNGPRFGGGLEVAPQARPDDGWLDAVRVAGCSSLAALLVLVRLGLRRHLNDRRVTSVRCRALTLTTDVAVAAALDGEPLPEPVTAARFRCSPSRLVLVGAADG